MGAVEEECYACILLVCGLPGCGKSTFCRALTAEGDSGQPFLGRVAKWHHICYDEFEQKLRKDTSTFEVAAWKAGREQAAERARELVAAANESKEHCVILLDDNMYYRSMRKGWYHLARENCCVYRQVFITACPSTCLQRNASREPLQRVPDFSIEHMAESFEWPAEGGKSWECQPLVTTKLDSEAQGTDGQLAAFVQRWLLAEQQEDPRGFWLPLPIEAGKEDLEPESQSEAHNCDVALRRVVSRALACIPAEISDAKSALAKGWSTRKSELVKSVGKTCKELGAEGAAKAAELIQEAEVLFLESCVADVQSKQRAQLLDAQQQSDQAA
eukprot:TRINITY_DN92724_c0_g1_i1.p1 TRINITY_DN92724_c0_g1~~TRINITY_DN92724_c0_g1_i1.p1  ORF type:complete len:330 (-),score=70.76 TRINITY_DN92724_c0_g1_i1:12-1001(-)